MCLTRKFRPDTACRRAIPYKAVDKFVSVVVVSGFSRLERFFLSEYITSKAFPFPPVGEYAPALPDILTATE